MIMWVMMLLMSNPLNGLLSHPPRDFASLLEPAAVLQKMDVQTTEDALVALLREKAAAPADADAGDALYVKKLMAIRLFEQTKPQNALPALQEVAKGPDVTLRDAAQEAIAAISGPFDVAQGRPEQGRTGGKPSPRPTGATLLKELSLSLPADAGFVLTLDMQRDSKATSLQSFMEIGMKEMEAKGLLGAFLHVPPEGVARMKENITRTMAGFEEKLAMALAQAGNMRVDAAVIVFSADAGVNTDGAYVGYLFKGLYDPERIGKLLMKLGPYQERDVAGRKVYVNDGGPHICLFDPNTLVAVTPFRGTETVHIEKMLNALTAAEKKAPQKALAAAFDLVTEKQGRLAAAGSLTPGQKDLIRAALAQNGPGTDPISEAGRQALLAFLQADSYNAAFDVQGKLSVQSAFADNASAAALGAAATNFQQVLHDLLSARQAEGAPPPLRAMLDPLLKGGALWQTDVAEKTATMKSDNALSFVMMMLMLRSQSAAVQRMPRTPAERMVR